MLVKRLICSILAGGAVLMFVGCRSTAKDDFLETDLPQPVIAENIVMETEFSEYDGNAEKIRVKLKNNSNEDFSYGYCFFMQKLDGDEWRYIGVSGYFKALLCSIPPSWDGWEFFELKDHVKLPLLPGRYRIGWWSQNEDGIINPTPVAEFDVK